VFELIEDRELAVLLLGVVIAAFVIGHLRQIRSFPWWPLPVVAAFCLLLGWGTSVAEDVWASPWLNGAEHVLYVLHSVLFSIWAVRLAREPQR
jgi:hypothetical protein